MIKKIIAYLLTVSMLFSMAVVNVNAEEVSAERVTKFENAVTLLTELGAISGTEFKFESEITKGQFVDILAKIIPVSDGQAEPVFGDVDSSHKYFKVIQGFAEAGYINGHAGNFEPDRAITYNEALYIILNTMGYADFMELVADYAAGGWQIASKLDLNTKNKGAIAGDIFYLLYQSLSTDMFDIAGMKSGSFVFETNPDKSLLETYHNIDVETGILESNGRVSINGQFVATDGKIVVDGEVYDYDKRCTILPGCEVDVFYDIDSDDVLCVVATAENEIIEIKYEQIEKFKDMKYTYKVDGKTKTLKLTSGADIVINNELVTKIDNDSMIPENGTVIIIDNGVENGYDVVYVNSYVSFVVKSVVTNDTWGSLYWKVEEEVKKENNSISYEKVDKKINVDLEENVPIIRDANGNTLKFTDIKVGMVVSVLTYAKGTDTYASEIVTSNAVVSGELSKIYQDDPSYLVIDGTKYYVSASSEYIVKNLAPQGNMTFYLDFMGNIVNVDVAGSGSMAYGYILDGRLTQNDDYEDCIELKLLSEIGSIIKYYLCPDKIYIDGANYGKDYDPETLFIDKFVSGGVVKEQLIRYDVNDDREISKIDFAEKISNFTGTSSVDNRLFENYSTEWDSEKSNAYAYYYKTAKNFAGYVPVDENTIIFKIPSPDLEEDSLPEDYQVIRGISKLNTGRYHIKSYTLGEDSMTASVIILANNMARYPDNPAFVVVKNVKMMLDEYGDVVYSITVDGLSGEKTYTTKTARVAEEAHKRYYPTQTLGRRIVPGDIITYYLDSTGTIIEDIEWHYDVKKDVTAGGGSVGDECRVATMGYVYAMDDTYIGITTTEPTSDNLAFNEYETYTTDGFKIFKIERSEKKAEISEASKSDLKAYKTSAKNCSKIVFIGSRGAGKLMFIIE